MEHSRGRQSRPHLLAGMFAAALAALFLFAGKLIALRLEDATISATAPEIFPLKNQGLRFSEPLRGRRMCCRFTAHPNCWFPLLRRGETSSSAPRRPVFNCRRWAVAACFP